MKQFKKIEQAKHDNITPCIFRRSYTICVRKRSNGDRENKDIRSNLSPQETMGNVSR